MPVILEPQAESVWLNPNITDPEDLLPLLHPYTIAPLDAYKVSKAVNRAVYDKGGVIEQIE